MYRLYHLEWLVNGYITSNIYSYVVLLHELK